jgi:hypothetical protein
MKLHLAPVSAQGIDTSDSIAPIDVTALQHEIADIQQAFLQSTPSSTSTQPVTLPPTQPITLPPTQPVTVSSPEGEDEVVFLGTGSAVPSKYRNGMHASLDVLIDKNDVQ